MLSARDTIIQKLNANKLPGGLPSPPPGDLQGNETMRIGVKAGASCTGCDEPIAGADARFATEFVFPSAVVRFHDACYKIWDEERRRPRRK